MISLCSHLLVIWLLFLFARLAGAQDPSFIANLLDFSAVPGGHSDGRQALLNAWNHACQHNGNARVLIPQGEFLIGPVVLEGPCKGLMELQVKGVVKAPPLDEFENGADWIAFQSINGLIVHGGGTFDGQGASAWAQNQCGHTPYCNVLPTSIKLNYVTDAQIKGISSINSKYFHINIYESSHITIRSVKISAPADSPNTDGIHIGNSNDVGISSSVIGTGDDCISIGPGSSNINIDNILCGPGHGISIGSLGKYANEDDVVGVNVMDCTLNGTTNGLRIKTWATAYASSASHISYSDIIMDNVYNPLIINQKYCPDGHCNQQTSSHVKIRDVTFRSISGTSASEVEVNMLCSEDVPCENVDLIDINLHYQEQGDHSSGKPSSPSNSQSTSLCSNVHGSASGKQIPPSCL